MKRPSLKLDICNEIICCVVYAVMLLAILFFVGLCYRLPRTLWCSAFHKKYWKRVDSVVYDGRRWAGHECQKCGWYCELAD